MRQSDPPDRPEATAPDLRVSRRALGRALCGATITSGLFAGCRPCFSPFPPRHETRRSRGPRTFTVRAEVLPGRFRRLEEQLSDPSLSPFEVPSPGVHYARLFTAEHRFLYFMVIYDDYEDALDLLYVNAKGVDPIFANCRDFPPGGAADRPALDAYVRDTLLCVELFYRAYNESQAEIRDALAFRDQFLVFLRSVEGLPEDQLRQRYAAFRNTPDLVNHDRDDDNDVPLAQTEAGRPIALTPLAPLPRTEAGRPVALAPVNAPDRVSPFTMMARVHPHLLPKLERTLRLGTFATIDLGMRPLKNLPTLHFARVSIIEGNQMLFASVYDGDFIQYVEDFSSRIAKEMDAVFGASVGYPLAGSRDVFQFKDFLRVNEILTRDFAGAYLDRSLLQIQSSLALMKAFGTFAKRVGPQHRNLPTRFQCFLHDNQARLT